MLCYNDVPFSFLLSPAFFSSFPVPLWLYGEWETKSMRAGKAGNDSRQGYILTGHHLTRVYLLVGNSIF